VPAVQRRSHDIYDSSDIDLKRNGALLFGHWGFRTFDMWCY